MTNKELGKIAEDEAAESYVSKGYRIVARNYRFRRFGEIDIIAKAGHKDLLVFCEVKCRTVPENFPPLEAITKTKIRRIRTVASAFLQAHREYDNTYIRFDVVEAILTDGKILINTVENAF